MNSALYLILLLFRIMLVYQNKTVLILLRFPYDWCPPSLVSPLDATHNGCVAFPTQFRLILVPPDHEPFGYFQDPPGPFFRLSIPVIHHSLVQSELVVLGSV